MSLFSPLTLPNGVVIPNRIAKAAMEENMADGDHAPSDELIRLYRQASGGECPIVLDLNTPSCGGSRFGCWTCTVVNKDKSLQGFVDVGKTEYQPLLEFRDWLVEIRNKPEYRQVERRNGTVTIKGGKHIPGPFTVEARQMILRRLLDIQATYGRELISQEEIDLIKQIWAEDLIQLHSKKRPSENILIKENQ